jgi:ABC-type nitrate/sulfonate/bicarbonate transport system substrate-binding protein
VELVVGTFTPSVLLAVARRTGRLAEHGLAVAEIGVPSSPAQFRSLRDGELDVALTSPDNVLAYRFDPQNPLGERLDARIVAAVDRGLGLGLYGRPGLTPDRLRGATVAVDVPASGFALAMYAVTESLGVTRDEYTLVTKGSTPRRREALLAGDCDATMLGAGNELLAEAAGAVRLGRVSDVCSPYLGTVVGVVGDRHLAGAQRLSRALAETARLICDGAADDVAAREAAAVLGLSDELARAHVERLKSPAEGLVPADDIDLAALRTVADLRRRYLPRLVAGVDVLEHALAPESGLVAGRAGRQAGRAGRQAGRPGAP